MTFYRYAVILIILVLSIACSPIGPDSTSETKQPTATSALAPTVTSGPSSQPTTPPSPGPTLTATTTPVLTPQATAMATASLTGQPSATLAPTPASITPVSTPLACISYREAAQHVGQTVCVTGDVYATAQSGNTYFINFSASRTAFYAVSFVYNQSTLPLQKEQCIKVTGRVDTFQGRPQIVINNLRQVTSC